MAVIVPADHPLAERESICLREIEPYPYILYEDDSGLRRLVEHLLQSVDVVPRVAYEAPDEEAIFSLVSAGFGVAFVAVTDALKKLSVRTLRVEDFDAHCTLYMAYNANRYLPPAAVRFVNYIKLCSKQGLIAGFKR